MGTCRICKNKLKVIINFGKIALVGNFFKAKKKLKKYNISLNFCKVCKHVQIAEILNPDLLFKNYFWETGVSKSNLELLRKLLIKIKKFKINNKSKILEIASNDGTFLKLIRKKFRCKVVGVDPAKNLNKNKQNNQILTIRDYFNTNLSLQLKKKFNFFDFIFARNVIAHVINPNEIFNGAYKLLSSKGIFILEFPHLLNIYRYNQYDNIFHEHNGFHSLKSIIDLSNNNNLKVFNIEKINSQGGSLRCYLCKKNNNKIRISKKIKLMLQIEKKIGLFSEKKLLQFKYKILNHINKMRKLLISLKNKRKRISVYGASGKGQALLQFCKINKSIVDYVFDKSKLKQECFTPGTNIIIKNPNRINKLKIDYLLLLSWNIKNEIIKQEKLYKLKGGKFIVPFPKPKILK